MNNFDRQAVERCPDMIGAMSDHDEKLIELRLKRDVGDMPHKRNAVPGQQQFLLSHALRAPGGEKDSGDHGSMSNE